LGIVLEDLTAGDGTIQPQHKILIIKLLKMHDARVKGQKKGGFIFFYQINCDICLARKKRGKF
ncbi:MAG: hypothetical protein KDC53_11630, partial [Saprospiraceae bacterium]|nr:hypothetical protein [Saprospiraceae bacterium]